MTATRSRLDQALVALSLADSRSQARALIMAGQVRVNGHTAAKAGTLVDPGADIEILEPPRFVGRGGEKLASTSARRPAGSPTASCKTAPRR